MNRPWMNFFERIIFVYEEHAISIFLENLRENSRMHTRTKGAFKIVVVYDRHLRVFIAPSRPCVHIDLLHDLRVRITIQIESRNSHQRFVVMREQELVLLLLILTGESHSRSEEH